VTLGILWLATAAFISRSIPLDATKAAPVNARSDDDTGKANGGVVKNATQRIKRGRQTFRFDTFGDEAFWGGTLQLHNAIAGAGLGGVGPGVSPASALAVGLKIDVDAIPASVRQQVAQGAVDLNDPTVTVALLKLNAVVGVTGMFDASGQLQSMGIQCALCHSTVDDSNPALCFGAIVPNPGTGCIGHRLDGWSNRDLNVGAIVGLSPNLTAFSSLLGVTQDAVRDVLATWGPGKFDAELILDGKAFNPQRVTDNVVTGTNTPGATLIPPAFGLSGVNLHTWTGWGSVPHWNGFVANLEMHGRGRFFDPRLNNGTQFPIAAANGFADLSHISPDEDRITSKLADLQLYQLSIPSPEPAPGSFDAAAASRGHELFRGQAGCNNCHVEPLWTEPGWNLHTPAEICIDDFQANRAPDQRYRTAPLGALFTHTKGGFYHDGRFATLKDVVDHYNRCMNLGLSEGQSNDLVQYLLSLMF
jgi:hypothetical protein